VDTEEIKAYIQLVQEATIEELSHYDVIFCTTAMATNVKLVTGMKNRIFQVIIDECGMCTEPESIATIIATRAKQVVLIGDHKQLQPIVVCPEARRLGLQKSLFERYKDDEHIVQLQLQYRMVNNFYLS
jgi:superfamily I DNA and/or RNA helicase